MVKHKGTCSNNGSRGKKGPPGPMGPQGAQGPQGPERGTKWFIGQGECGAGVEEGEAMVGDFFLDLDTCKICVLEAGGWVESGTPTQAQSMSLTAL